MKKLLRIFSSFIFVTMFVTSAHAAATTFFKMGGSGTISNLLYAHNGNVCAGTACSNTTTCCISGVSGTSTGTANVAISPNGNSINTPGVSLLERYGSLYQWPPLYMPGTRTIPMPPGVASGGTAPLMGVVAAPEQLGTWCNNVPYGNVSNSMCFPGGTQGKVTGQFSGGVYAVWSCNGGFYAPPVASTPINNHDSCIPVEGGWYSPFRELDRYPCPANNYCPAAEVGCPVLTANVANSMIPNKSNCKTVSTATTGTAALPNYQPVACPDTANCAAAPILCATATGNTHTLADPLSNEITDCYYQYNAGCPVVSPVATTEGRVYYPGGNANVVCENTSCISGYALLDGMCVMGCPAGKYMSGGSCIDCPAGRYCVGGFQMPEDCPNTHLSPTTGTTSEEMCYNNCPVVSPVTAVSGFDFFVNPTCAATNCISGYIVRSGQCILSCPAGQYNNNGTCTQCPAGSYCPQNDPAAPIICPFGEFCPAGSATPTDCPLTHPNSQPGAQSNGYCYVVGSCSAPFAQTSQQWNYFNNTVFQNTCVALTCIAGYHVVDWQCISETNLTIATLNKAGGTGTILGVGGGGNATMNCNNFSCGLPALTGMTRGNSVYNYDSGGTSYPVGRWCTAVDGGGTCYTAGQTHVFTNINSITLYAMWSCAGGYYAVGNTCVAVGSGYFSPNYATTRTQCQAGYFCAGTTASSQTPCPSSHPDSAVGNTSNMTCRRACSLPGADQMVPGGWNYFGMPSTCEAASCIQDWTLDNGKCLPPNNSCPPGYYFDSYCKDCASGYYCEGDEDPPVACPQKFPSSEARNPSIDNCFTPCIPGNYHAVLMMTGRDYYDNKLSSCVALICINGYSLDNGVCVPSSCPAGQFMNNNVCDTCGAGKWYNGTPGSGCTPVGNEFYSPVNDARKYACPQDTLSGGDGIYAASITECTAFKMLKVDDGTDVTEVIMRTAKVTSPSLHVYDGTNMYYGNLSLTATGGAKELKLKSGNNTYYVSDNIAP